MGSTVRIMIEALLEIKKNGLFGGRNESGRQGKVKTLSKIPREHPPTSEGRLRRRRVAQRAKTAKRFIRNPDRNYRGSEDNR